MLYVELAIVTVLILVNGLLALAELAIVSSRRARLQAMVDREVVGARRALALASDPGRFLSTVQIGITLVGVLSGAFSGATLGLRLAEWFAQLGLPAGVAEAVGVGLVVTVITYFSLVIGELVPKQIALRNPEKIAVRVAPAMTAIARIASPVVSFLDISGRAVLRALGYQAQAEHRVTDEEIRTLMAEAETAGVIEPGERAMIAGVMRLGDRPVRAVMTPRREVDMVDLTDDPDDIRRTHPGELFIRDCPFTPARRKRCSALFRQRICSTPISAASARTYRSQVRPAANVPDTADALDVVDVIKASPVHMALVHDEYGHFQGVVTNADILEAIVGDFRTDEGPVEPDAVQRDDGSWLIAGSMPVDEMADRLFIALPPGAQLSYGSGLHAQSARSFAGHRRKLRSAKAGVSRSSISMAAASTRFWPGALPPGGGAQRSSRRSGR